MESFSLSMSIAFDVIKHAVSVIFIDSFIHLSRTVKQRGKVQALSDIVFSE